MARPALRCFVAMAVGRTDTNKLYDKHIAPTLRAAGIHPVFMGRLEHNDDIDKRIIQEIQQSDFAIADLTYARPSVYFEAGYAQRDVPVIFTARRDHSQSIPKDEFGNFRVHFDLLMRNIIWWSSQKDTEFAGKLARRIKTVTAPRLRQRQSDEHTKQEQLQFQKLSLASRIDCVTKTFRKQLVGAGYAPLTINENFHPWIGRIPNRRILNISILAVDPTFTKNTIRERVTWANAMLESRFEVLHDDEGYNLQRWQNQWRGHKTPQADETKYVTQIVAHLVLCSLDRIPRARLDSALPSCIANDTGQLFAGNFQVRSRHAGFLPLSMNVHVYADIKSISDAAKKARDLKITLKAQNQRR